MCVCVCVVSEEGEACVGDTLPYLAPDWWR